MPRNRMIKPEFWDDEKLAKISRDARLTFIGMWNHSDDYGVVKGSPIWLKNQIYPYDNKLKIEEFEKWLTEIIEINAIIPFPDGCEDYYFIRNFLKHQTINRPSLQRNPKPPDNIIEEAMRTQGALIDEVKLREVKLREDKEREDKEKREREWKKLKTISKKLIIHLNKISGRNFTPEANIDYIIPRLKQGYTFEQCKSVIEKKWLDEDFNKKYYCPETLFRKSKIEKYLNEDIGVGKCNNQTTKLQTTDEIDLAKWEKTKTR